MIVNVTLSIGLAGCRIRDVLEFEDGATEEEIEAEIREWALERAEWSWEAQN